MQFHNPKIHLVRNPQVVLYTTYDPHLVRMKFGLLDYETSLLLLPLLRIPHYSNFCRIYNNRTKVRTTLSEVPLGEDSLNYYIWNFLLIPVLWINGNQDPDNQGPPVEA